MEIEGTWSFVVVFFLCNCIDSFIDRRVLVKTDTAEL